MFFKRIDKNTVRCILTEQDMIDNGLAIEDFIKNKDKVQGFLESIIEMAREEIGYETTSGVLAMQIMPLSNNGLAITFSESQYNGLESVIDQIKEIAGDMIPGIMSDVAADSNAVKGEKISRKHEGRLYAFDSMKNVEELCSSIKIEKVNKSILYKEDDKYYMIIKKGKLSKKVYESLCFSFLEYGKLVSDDPAVLVNWQEHRQPMIKKNAIGIIKSL